MSKITEAFEAWWADTGEQSLFALNTTTDDDIKILAGIAWEAAIRKALAEQSKCACDSPAWCTKYKKCNREMLGLPKAEPVKQEPVMDYEHICALRESEQIQAGDSYFFVRPENDTPTSRKMFFQGFERGFHKGLKYAAQVSAKREWVELTDDELKAALEVHQVGLSIRIGRIAIAAFKEKNK